MTNKPAIAIAPLRSVRAWAWISAGLAIILLSPLISIPLATFTSNQPWKVELLSSLFICVLILWLFLRNNQGLAVDFSLSDINSRSISVMIVLFGLWSGLSLVWAQSPLMALHHTLAWSIYLIYFVIFLSLLRFENGMRIILWTFVLLALVLGASCLIDYITIVDFTSAEGPIRVRYGKFAELLITISPLLWVATVYVRDRRSQLFILPAAAISWVTVMLSLSRGAFISGIVGFTILFAGCFLFSIRRIRKRVIVLAGVWLALTLAVQILFSTALAIPSTTDF